MDCFALLEEQRRPWLEEDALKAKFLALSAEVHPDRVHEAGEPEKRAAHQRFTDLNQAYQRLRDVKERLQHLLELEADAPLPQVQQVPPELMDLAMRVGLLCKEADSFLSEKAGTVSPLLQVGLFERSQEWIEKLNTIKQGIESRREELMTSLRELDRDWVSGMAREEPNRSVLLRRLETLYRLFSYYNRWTGQLQERLARLLF